MDAALLAYRVGNYDPAHKFNTDFKRFYPLAQTGALNDQNG